MARATDDHTAYSFILTQLRANNYTVIDLAHLATVLGKQRPPFPSPSALSLDGNGSMGSSGVSTSRGNGDKNTDAIGAVVAQLVQEIEETACVHLRDGTMEPRQLASILWMFGRLGIQPSNPDFRGLICVFVRERVRTHDRLKHVILGGTLQ
jgi:hypothetical protein